MPTYRLDLIYDGSGFHGFARQQQVRTVQGDLEEALERLVGHRVETTCAGRTDAGVHAYGQVVSFAVEQPLDTGATRRALNAVLGPEVAVTGCQQVPDDFDARFSARWRSYRYFVLDAEVADPLRRWVVWHVSQPLDVEAMDQAVKHLVGQHDFASFCRAKPGASTVREVQEASWRREADLAVFAIRASAFCHQMVRSIVGFVVEVGRGRFPPERTAEVLQARDRAATRASVAPAQGLVLWAVGYE